MLSGDPWGALTGLFWAFIIAVGSAILLAIYVVWSTFFGLTSWEICSKMKTDQAKIECMEIMND